jgi:hypothetical protein
MPSKAAGPRIFLSDWIVKLLRATFDVGYFPPNTPPEQNQTRSVHETVDEQDYNGGTQNDPPIGNLHSRYRCFPAKPFHGYPPN